MDVPTFAFIILKTNLFPENVCGHVQNVYLRCSVCVSVSKSCFLLPLIINSVCICYCYYFAVTLFLIYNQQDVTFLSLFISVTLYMFRVEPPPVMRSSDCTHSFWFLSNLAATCCSHDWDGTGLSALLLVF
jgi:hypothetical protein